MGRKRMDAIDLACLEWARCKRKMLGLEEPRLAREMIGPLRSTLGARRDLHAGSRSEGKVGQHWPEVYESEQALEVARAYHQMGDFLRPILDLHYVFRGHSDAKAKVLFPGKSREERRSEYWGRLEMAKAFVEGWTNR